MILSGFEFVFKIVQGVSGVIIAANVPDKWISADAFSFPPESHFFVAFDSLLASISVNSKPDFASFLKVLKS